MADTDIVLINPGDRKQTYQALGQDYSAIEPPFWAASLAAYLRNRGFNVRIIDANADNLSPLEVAAAVKALDPLLAAVVVYGNQPSASTQNMDIARRICLEIKKIPGLSAAISGLHPTALPKSTMEETAVDFLVAGEGQIAFEGLLNALRSGKKCLTQIPGLWYRDGKEIKDNPVSPLVKELDEFLPVAAWDLLPMEKYRAHNWHCFDDIQNRSPYAAVYTSLGCPFSCDFCCINALFGKAGIRYRSPRLVVDEIGLLAEKYKVKNIKIIDELFIFDEKHYMPIVDMLIERDYGLNIWAYARVDTVNAGHLKKLKQAGINWLALGIESANPKVRDGARKNMRRDDIKDVVGMIHAAGIRVIGNYIFGLPDDDMDTMRETLSLAKELNCEFANFYYALGYPGSKLYNVAIANGWPMPDTWQGFSQHGYDALPLPTKYLSPKDVLRFRDEAFMEYYKNPVYLKMLEDKFTIYVRRHVEELTRHKLKRRLLEDDNK